MKTLCLYFQVHQPLRLRTYRFFDIGQDHYYYDEFANKTHVKKLAEGCYLPANKILLNLIKEYPDDFKVSFSISGVALEQLEKYAPEVVESFQDLAETGNVEFLSETYGHSLSALKSKNELKSQIDAHSEAIQKYFGQKPEVFRNTELIYSDEIGRNIADMGFRGMITEGPRHVLGWKSPNYCYNNAVNPKLKLLLKNFRLSDDIGYRFSSRDWEEWPITVEKYATWLNKLSEEEEVVNLFMGYETFGEYHKKESGIFDFLKALPPYLIKNSNYKFKKISNAFKSLQPVGPIHVPWPISWADEERDITSWLGNDMQDEAFEAIYSLEPMVKELNDDAIKRDWVYLQTSNHFYYMCTKFFSNNDLHQYYNPYNSPYEAFINYMNVLSDFRMRVEQAYENGSNE